MCYEVLECGIYCFGTPTHLHTHLHTHSRTHTSKAMNILMKLQRTQQARLFLGWFIFVSAWCCCCSLVMSSWSITICGMTQTTSEMTTKSLSSFPRSMPCMRRLIMRPAGRISSRWSRSKTTDCSTPVCLYSIWIFVSSYSLRHLGVVFFVFYPLLVFTCMALPDWWAYFTPSSIQSNLASRPDKSITGFYWSFDLGAPSITLLLPLIYLLTRSF